MCFNGVFGRTGSGVRGHVVAAVRVALYADGTAAHVRIHHLWCSARPVGTQQHQSERRTSSGTRVHVSLDTYVMLCFLFLLQSMVQVETLGELGVFFTLFVVGLEFSPERLHKVRTGVTRKEQKTKSTLTFLVELQGIGYPKMSALSSFTLLQAVPNQHEFV